MASAVGVRAAVQSFHKQLPLERIPYQSNPILTETTRWDPGIGQTAAKGMLVDFPLAIIEGLKSIPQLYGGNVRDHKPVTGAKSGMVVAGKTFTWGFIDGLSDFVIQPYKGAKKEGALGATKGFGKGATSLVTKSGAGMFGVFAYPSTGISKSLWTAVHSSTRKAIAKEHHEEGVWMMKKGMGTQLDWDEVVHRFI
ncbi:uncharacterized protein FPRO_16009 [Fusarium proliferatum ET1]|uniref:Uncharacterized protein n=1 Tax=Fusarium proliferatum (strain ET1) TaxID=1227346 RepID=A0A1L7WB14_FUSPR|nr:uncharacterized protein FPRO_16009 [Fusarium proliferatum ET1]CZR49801.1 uncharacterized protein FPRO_16009 [Fusarium proliferatum ET1]